jgi:imidazolonepropionase-like amidohydrolase
MGPDGPRPKKVGPEAVREFIAEQAAIGFDAVKLLMSNDDVFVEGGSMITQYSPEEARAAGEQARESGVWLNCHAQAPESIKLAVRNGFRSVYHCTYADVEAVDLLEEHKGSIFLSPAVGIMWANVHEGAEYGIDTAMAEKMGSVKALHSMTTLYPELRKRGLRVLPGGGQVMDLPVGLLAPGYLADVLVVRGEPAQDVTVLQDAGNLLAIMQNGAFYKLAGHLSAA